MKDAKKATILILTAIILLGLVLTFKKLMSSKDARVEMQTKATMELGVKWPIFRGDRQLSGHVTSLPDRLDVKWTFRALSSVGSGPVVENDKVLFGDVEGNFYCLNLNDGKLVWKKKLSDGFQASALLVDGVCYVGSQSGEFFALSTADGKVKWRFKCPEQIGGSANYFVKGKKRYVVFGSYDFKMRCLDAGNGKEIWNLPTGNYINGAPAVDGNNIVFGGCDGYLRIVDAFSGKQEHKVKLKSYVPASPAIRDGIIYAGVYDKRLFAIDFKGKKTWTYESVDEAPFRSSPAVNDDYVVIADRGGLVQIMNRTDGQHVADFQASGDIASGPVISNKRGMIADKDGILYIFELATGTKIIQKQLGSEISAPLAVAGSIVIVADDDGNIIALNSK